MASRLGNPTYFPFLHVLSVYLHKLGDIYTVEMCAQPFLIPCCLGPHETYRAKGPLAVALSDSATLHPEERNLPNKANYQVLSKDYPCKTGATDTPL